MKTVHVKQESRLVLAQNMLNSTKWIGFPVQDAENLEAGQIFTCPIAGLLKSIQVFPTYIQKKGEITLSLAEFDPVTNKWGDELSRISRSLEKNDEDNWLQFSLDPVHLSKERILGFRLHTEDDFIGLGEAVTVSRQPFAGGYEWASNRLHPLGKLLQYYSLTYRLEMCA